MSNHHLQLLADVELTGAAAAGDNPKVSVLAYTGGKMSVGGWGAVVIDLAGLTLPARVPLLADHANDVGGVIGQGTAAVRGGVLHVEGELIPATAAGRAVVDLAKGGFKFQASVGVSPTRTEYVRDGEVKVNGTTVKADGGFTLVRAGVLREVSILAVGADRNTAVTVTANGSEGGKMNETLTDPVAVERSRIQKIHKLCEGSWGEHAGRVVALRDQAVNGELSVEDLQAGLLGILRASRATPPAIAGAAGMDQGQLLAAALCVAQGVSPQFLASHYGERIVDAAVSRPNRGMSVQGLLRQVIAAAGGHAPTGRFTDAGIRTAFEADRQLRASGFSSLSLPGILSDVAHKLLLEAYTAAAVTWPKFCRTAANSDFKTHKRYRLTASGAFEEVGKAGELKHISLNESEYSNTLATYGAMIVLTRQDIINDDLGALGSVPRLLGRLGAVKVEKAVYTLLIGNAGSFFGPANGNYISGVTTNLAAEGLRQALAVFREQTDSNGDPILVEPTVLVIPPALEATALSLNNGTAIVLAGNTDVQLPDTNVWKGKFAPVVAPFLAASAGLGGVDTNWYLTSGPSDYSPIEVAFLNGQQTPTVESADVDFNTLGVGMRGYFDFGVAFLDHRGGVKSKGAA